MASTASFDLDTHGLNRVWADSEAFTYSNPTGCVGPYGGTYSGASAGTLEAYFDCNNSISVNFVSYLGHVEFESVASVQPDGTVAGSFSGATLNGTFDYDGCTASGTWSYAGYLGSWSVARSEPGPCMAPPWLLTPEVVSRQAAGGVFGVAITLSETTPWSAGVTSGADWLRITSPLPANGTSSAILWAQFDANLDPASRTGTIRVNAPAANPIFREVTLTQAGTAPPPAVSHFEFDPIEGPYMVNEPIPVTIRAIDASSTAAAPQVQSAFTGWVDLSTNSSALVSPRRVRVENGVSSKSVSLDLPFPETILKAISGHIMGESNSFTLLSETGETGCIAGLAMDGILPENEVEVFLYSSSGILLDTVITSSERRCSQDAPLLPGKYCFCDLQPGFYEVQGVKGVRESLRRRAAVANASTTTQNIDMGDTSKPPVLLVGGILGSREEWMWPPYPVITGLPGSPAPSSLKLIDWRGVRIGEADYVWLALAGLLRRHFRVVEVPWDWRARISDELVATYLLPKLKDARRRTDGTAWPQVRIAAHSAGGLLVRHYVQSYAYANDIESFAMAGTPAQGAAILYYIWEGASPGRADLVADAGSLFPSNFYGTTLKELYEKIDDDEFPDSASAEPADLWRFIRKYVPGLGDLLPPQPFLVRGGWFPMRAHDDWGPEVLEGLVDSPNADRMVGAYSSDSRKIRTKLFLSKPRKPQPWTACGELSAVHTIAVGPARNSPGLYFDGVPLHADPACAPGDGTVKWYDKSDVGLSQIDQMYPHHEGFREAKHVLLMHEYADAICAFLNSNQPCSAGIAGISAEDDAPAALLSIFISGRVQPFLIAPDGLAAGIDPSNGELVQTIPGAEVTVASRAAGLGTVDPINGLYELQINAVPGDVFTVNVSYEDADRFKEAPVRGIYHDGIVSAIIELNPLARPVEAEPAATLDRAGTRGRAGGGSKPTSPPSGPRVVGEDNDLEIRSTVLRVYGELEPALNMRSENNDGFTEIVWDAPGDPAVTGYNVYARPDDMPKYTLLGTTADTFFNTPHAWNVAGSAPTWHYFVTAVNAEGIESFFTHTVENRHRLVARVSSDVTTGVEPLTVAFADASLGEVVAWAWDFESDGVIDSTEHSPVHTYESPGSYTVTLTVGGPEGTDTTIRPGYITVEPIVPPPPPVPGDFDGDQDVDLTDHAALVERLTGPLSDPVLAGWHLLDLDFDYDVDIRDFAAWQRLVTSCDQSCE